MTGHAKAFDCGSCKWGRHCDARNPAPDPEHFFIPTAPGMNFTAPPSHDAEGTAIKYDGPSHWVAVPGMIEWRSAICPLPIIDHFSIELLRLYGFYKDRLLPLAGGLYDQPNLYLQAMQITARRREAQKP